ncbi:MAG: hypothetical protein U0228_14900 [Myxococcaceae bacterium]
MTGALVTLLLAGAPGDDRAVHAREPTIHDEGQRLRFGISASMGAQVFTHADGGVAFAPGAELRLGWQATPQFGFVVGAAAMVGLIGSIQGRATALVEITLDEHVVAGVGSVLGVGHTSSHTRFEVISSGPQLELAPGFDLRLVFGVPRSIPPTFARAGLNIGLEVVVLWHPLLHAPGVTLESWSLSPLLSIGFETR